MNYMKLLVDVTAMVRFFNNQLRNNSNLLKKYLVLVESLIPLNKQIVAFDMDLRNEDQFNVAKNVFSEAGYSVWVVSR